MRTISIYSLLLLMLVSLASCDRVEGCLDSRASNFDVSADKDCCCTYPIFNLRIYPTLNADTYSPVLFKEDAIGTVYQVNDYRMYFSGIRLVRDDSVEFEIIDGLNVSLLDAEAVEISEELKDDYLCITPSVLTYEVGAIIAAGNFDKIRFYIGLDSVANSLSPSSFDEDHALADKTPSMYQNDSLGYTFFSSTVVLERGDTVRSTLLTSPKMVEVDFPVNISANFDFELNLEMNLEALFEGVSFLTDDENTIQGKIVNNFESAFFKYSD